MATQTNDSPNTRDRVSKRPRLTIDISPQLRRRIKAAAALRDMTVREYVAQILEEAVPEEPAGREGQTEHLHRLSPEGVQRLFETSKRIMRGRVFTDDSTDLLSEAREERMEEL
ncbi:MAG TPA: hypothetical protein VF116_16565 [Ktedonobacterales bacterium]